MKGNMVVCSIDPPTTIYSCSDSSVVKILDPHDGHVIKVIDKFSIQRSSFNPVVGILVDGDNNIAVLYPTSYDERIQIYSPEGNVHSALCSLSKPLLPWYKKCTRAFLLPPPPPSIMR
jgi:hypothetical protein